MDLDRFLSEHGIAAHAARAPAGDDGRGVGATGAEASGREDQEPLPARQEGAAAPPRHRAARHRGRSRRARRGARRRRLGFASAERLQKYLGVTPGSVSLLGLVNDEAHAVEFVIDRALWEADAVQAHPLVNTATMVVAHADLERFLAATGHAPRVIDVPVAVR